MKLEIRCSAFGLGGIRSDLSFSNFSAWWSDRA